MQNHLMDLLPKIQNLRRKFNNSVLKDIVDKHAPEKSRLIVVRADAPWYTSERLKEKGAAKEIITQIW